MAAYFGGAELVLLKSVTPADGTTIVQAARDGLVDPHFPTAARHLARVATVNFRDDPPVETVLAPSDATVGESRPD